MAHFAEINNNNIVTRVIVVANEEILDNGVESEAKGIAFCQSLFGGNWVQTSYNGNIRKNYAGIEFIYDPILDAFIAPKPEDYIDNGVTYTAVLNEETGAWNMVVSE
jgi:hypothetical protein